MLFIRTVIPYRTEWRYSILAAKLIALDAGHVCQDLYLASEAIGAGTCAIGAYWQEEMDTILVVDQEEEFAIYVARVGKVKVEDSERACKPMRHSKRGGSPISDCLEQSG